MLPKKVGGWWCMKDGEWTVKAFDVIARISGRVIITSTVMMFMTMCHSSWNALASYSNITRSFLWNVKADNIALHSLVGKTVGVCTVLHVWSLLLPSIFSGYENTLTTGEPFTWPAQISLPLSQIDVTNKLSNWGMENHLDDGYLLLSVSA